MISNVLCVNVTQAKKIKISEIKSRKAFVLNPAGDEFHVVNFDGCVVKNEVAADFVISKETVGDLIIELKGKDVKHAMEQIMATATFLRENELSEGRLGGVVVCKEYPKITTTIQTQKLGLKKKFNCPVKVFTKDGPEIDFTTSLGPAPASPAKKKR